MFLVAHGHRVPKTYGFSYGMGMKYDLKKRIGADSAARVVRIRITKLEFYVVIAARM